MIKRISAAIVAAALSMSMLTACSSGNASSNTSSISSESGVSSESSSLLGTSSEESSDDEGGVTVSKEAMETPSASQDIFAMDTYMTVTAYGDKCTEAVQAAVDEINRLDDLWSVGNSESEISILNENGSVILSDETYTVVKEALELYDSTGGLFDITVYPLMVEWGFTTEDYKVPTDDKIKELLKLTGIDKITLDDETHQITLQTGTQIDLGGIAKGYTSAKIMEIFSEYGIVSGLVSLGGNVQLYGTKVDGSDWRVGVENPDNTIKALSTSDYIGVVQISDKALITSGGYQRYFVDENGEKHHHIIDPRTGSPSNSGLISVTIVSDDGLLADGLSTSLFIMGKDDAVSYWHEHSDQFDFILVDSEGKIYVSKGIESNFSSELDYEIVE